MFNETPAHRYYSLEEEVRTLHMDVEGRVNVASIYSVGVAHMEGLVQTFTNRHPQANVRLEYQHPDMVCGLGDAGQADFGLASYPQSTRTISAMRWRDEPMVLVCAPDHPFAQEEKLPLTALDGQRLVAFDSGLKIRRELDKALTAAEAEPEVAMEFDNIENIKRAVEINAGVSLLPLATISREIADGSLIAVQLTAEIARPLGIIQRKGVELGKTARRFIELLLEEGVPSATSQRSAMPPHQQRTRSSA